MNKNKLNKRAAALDMPVFNDDENTPAIKVKDLSVEYHSGGNISKAVNHLSFELGRRRTLGLVGETGAGKTSTALALMRLLPDRVSKMTCEEMTLNGCNVLDLPEQQMKMIRGETISMIFQDPMTALNPIMTVGDQIREAVAMHMDGAVSKADIDQRVDTVLEMVGIPKERKKDYPLQFSGGMKQRVVIAMALSCEPSILIADEPTTALDVTIQAQVLELIKSLRDKMGTSMIMISHDLGVIVRTCDDVGVMYAGEIIEYGTVEQIFSGDRHHPYTVGLFGAIPDIHSKADRLTPIEGLMPDPTDLPEGCRFSPRCTKCMEICRKEMPCEYVKDGHRIKCHLFGGADNE